MKLVVIKGNNSSRYYTNSQTLNNLTKPYRFVKHLLTNVDSSEIPLKIV